jgi:hypothetical protein
MVFLVRRPFIFITVGVIIVFTSIALISYTGIFTTKPSSPQFSLLSFTPTEVNQGQNITLTIIIKNFSKEIQDVEFNINVTSSRVKFGYTDSIMLEPTELGKWYIFKYPEKQRMAPDEEWTEILKVIASVPDQSEKYQYSVFFSLYSNGVLTDNNVKSLVISK